MGKNWKLFALLLIASVWLYRTPYNASNLETVPDSVEYALAPWNFLESGRYEIVLEGRGLPPRYPPWFPLLVILPAFVLFGPEVGNAILPVTLLAIAGIAFAWAIGKRISSVAGGVFAALAVLCIPSYSMWSAQVMSDVPCTAMMLAACLVYLRVTAAPQRLILYFAAGALIALTTLFRPVFAAMLLPFLLTAFTRERAFFFRCALLLVPMMAAVAATFAYNAATFGSPFRNGYKFWSAVPVDYPAMMFSLSNVPANLGEMAQTPLPILLPICGIVFLLARAFRRPALAEAQPRLRAVMTFFGLTCGPIFLFHLIYFFPSDRFYLPLLAAAGVIAGSLLGLLIEPGRARIFRVLLPIVFILVVAGRIAVSELTPHRRLAADRVRAHTPPNAMIISAIDPVYLEHFAARGSARRIIPLSRTVEYASKVLVRKKVKNPQPPPISSRDGRALALLKAGAPEAVNFVAIEQMDAIVRATNAGTPLFLDATFVGGRTNGVALEQLRKRYNFVERAPYLDELEPL